MDDAQIEKFALYIANKICDGYGEDFTTTDLQKAVDMIKSWYTNAFCSNGKHQECLDFGCHCDCGHSALARSFE